MGRRCRMMWDSASPRLRRGVTILASGRSRYRRMRGPDRLQLVGLSAEEGHGLPVGSHLRLSRKGGGHRRVGHIGRAVQWRRSGRWVGDAAGGSTADGTAASACMTGGKKWVRRGSWPHCFMTRPERMHA